MTSKIVTWLKKDKNFKIKDGGKSIVTLHHQNGIFSNPFGKIWLSLFVNKVYYIHI